MSELKADKTFVFGEECEAYKKSEADKVIAHQKYKRCLAMAEACMHKRWRLDEEGFDYARSTRQMNKWLELAEKFKDKEAK